MSSLTLLWLASYSNFTSIFIIIFCFLAMTIFIGFVSYLLNLGIRRKLITSSPYFESTNWDNIGGTRLSTSILQRNMMKMQNPFVIQLDQINKKLKDGLHFHLSSLCPSEIFILWGVKINPFHDLLLKPGKHIKHVLEDNEGEEFTALESLHMDQLSSPEAGYHYISIPCPEAVCSNALGTMPRKSYPVCVLVFVADIPSQDTDTDQCGSENSIMGLVSVIHLQDDKLAQSSHVISQFVKTCGVQVFSLQPLFLSSGSDEHNPDNMSHHGSVCEQTLSAEECSNADVKQTDIKRSAEAKDNSAQEDIESNSQAHSHNEENNTYIGQHTRPECVVCQTRQARCALLPCRHACVCLGCFRLLDRCPMCRGPLDSYFILSSIDDSEDIDESHLHEMEGEESLVELQHQAVSQYFTQAWERLNLRLNALLGFR